MVYSVERVFLRHSRYSRRRVGAVTCVEKTTGGRSPRVCVWGGAVRVRCPFRLRVAPESGREGGEAAGVRTSGSARLRGGDFAQDSNKT